MNANLIHKWLKDPRFVPELDGNAVVDPGTGFLPVEIADTVAVSLVDEAPQMDVAVSATLVTYSGTSGASGCGAFGQIGIEPPDS